MHMSGVSIDGIIIVTKLQQYGIFHGPNSYRKNQYSLFKLQNINICKTSAFGKLSTIP